MGFLFTYSVWFLIATISFWIERLNNLNDILPSLRRLSQVPRSVYTGISSVAFCLILPVVLVTSVPAEILLGKSSNSWSLYFVLISLFMFWLSRKFFFFSIKKYSSAGS
jgi:ABC-2 type transport system permease protein